MLSSASSRLRTFVICTSLENAVLPLPNRTAHVLGVAATTSGSPQTPGAVVRTFLCSALGVEAYKAWRPSEPHLAATPRRYPSPCGPFCSSGTQAAAPTALTCQSD